MGDIIESHSVPFSQFPDKLEDLSEGSQQLLKEIRESSKEEGDEDEDVEADDRSDGTGEGEAADTDGAAVGEDEDDSGEGSEGDEAADDEGVDSDATAEVDDRFSQALARVQESNAQLDEKRKTLDTDLKVVRDYEDLIGEDGASLETDPLSTMRSIFMSATHKDDPAQFEQKLYDQLTSTVLGLPDKNDESLTGQQKLQRQLDVLKRQQKQAEEKRTEEDLDRQQTEATKRAVDAFQNKLETDDSKAKYPFLHAGANQPGELVWGVVEGEYKDSQTKLSFEEAALLAEDHIKTNALALHKRFEHLLAASTDSDGERAEADQAKTPKGKTKKAKAASLTAKDASSGPGKKPNANEWPEDEDESLARVRAELKKLNEASEEDDY